MIDPTFSHEHEPEDPAPRARRLRLRIRLPRRGSFESPAPRRRPVLKFLAFATLASALFAFIVIASSGYGYDPIAPDDFSVPQQAFEGARLAAARAEEGKLRARLTAAAPRGNYIVVDRTNNKLRVMRDGRVELDTKCSAGSGSILSDVTGERSWIFDTPRGEFRVKSKTKNPVWRKPDWAFVEEGQPIPKDPAERIEYGTLGEYALHLGDGYMIHGTLYERLLGRNVTHGCIRLGRDDLRQVNAAAPVGTRVFIY